VPTHAIAKATLTFTSAYSAAPASTVGYESWGYITLWDIRPWMPWSSRGLVGPTNWEGYLTRHGVFDSTQAPGYNPVPQGPKSWAYRTDSVVIYDSTVSPAGTYPYTPVSAYGAGPYTYVPGYILSPAAFDDSSVSRMLSTLVVAIYAFNSVPPASGGPTATDELNFYGCYLDVSTTGGGVPLRAYPTGYVVIAPGPNVGTPTGVASPGSAIDVDPSFGSAAIVQETNGNNAGFGALWHPAVLLLTWTVAAGVNHAFIGSSGFSLGSGRNASFVG
jgi:hypothetical protein